jgi:phage shock protein C
MSPVPSPAHDGRMNPLDEPPLTLAPDDRRPLPPPQPPAWRLVRARHHVLAGVCEGLSAATGVDVTLVRLAFVAVGLTGVGVLAYVVLALLVPREEPAAGRPLRPAPPDTARWLRGALLVAPIASLVGLFGGPWRGPFVFGFWGRGGGFGLLLIAVGVFVIWLRRRKDNEPVAANSAVPTPAWWEGRPRPEPSPDPTMAVPQTRQQPSRFTALVVARVLAWLAVIAAVLAGAATFWLEWIDALSIPSPVLMFGAGALAISLIIATTIRSASALPVFASIAALVVPVVLIVSLGAWNGGVGNRLVVPTTLGPTQEYRLAIGRLTLDLSQAALDGTQAAAVTAVDKIGSLEVIVPADASVTINAHVGAGQTRIFGDYRSGLNVSDRTTDTPAATKGTIHLDLDVAVGQLAVCRERSATVPLAEGCSQVVAPR